MASPDVVRQIDAWLRGAGLTDADFTRLRTAAIQMANAAEGGDRDAQARLLQASRGAVVATPVIERAGQVVVEGEFGEEGEPLVGPSRLRLPAQQAPVLAQPTGAAGGLTAPLPVGGPQPTGVPGVFIGEFPDLGIAILYQQAPIFDDFGDPTGETEFKKIQTISLDEAAGTDPSIGFEAQRIFALMERGIIGEEEGNERLRNLGLTGTLGGAGAAGLTESQRLVHERGLAGLDIQRGQLQLSRDQATIAAARAGNPLALLGLTTGATPREALNLIPPAPSQVTIQHGGVLGRPRFSGGPQGLRLPGVQAQSRETPTELAARRERTAVEFGLTDPEQEFFESRIRRAAGPRLSLARTGGSIR